MKSYLRLTVTLVTALMSLSATGQHATLAHGFAHNDYQHKRPLYEALENGYTYIEADIHLWNNELIVAHVIPVLRQQQTLEKLYLAPLFNYIKSTDRKVRHQQSSLTLMIDIKSGSERTYKALALLLEKYREIISEYRNGQVIQRQLTIVISGNKPIDFLKAQQNRLAFVDANLLQVQSDTLTNQLCPIASCKYSRLLKWTGQGDFPAEERDLLCSYVALAHRHGKKVRLWASPENSVVWKALLDCGVDLINTDRLTDLKDFLTTGKHLPPRPSLQRIISQQYIKPSLQSCSKYGDSILSFIKKADTHVLQSVLSYRKIV